MLNNKCAQAGFSLIELVTAIAILGVLFGMLMPSYRAWVHDARIRTTTESIQNGLQLARAEAVHRNTNVQFVLGAGSSWTVGCQTVVAAPIPPATTPLECPATIQSRSTAEGSSASVVVTPTPVAGTSIVFNNLGTVVADANTFTRLDFKIDPALPSAAESNPLRVTVGGGGNIRMCNPSLTSPDPRAC